MYKSGTLLIYNRTTDLFDGRNQFLFNQGFPALSFPPAAGGERGEELVGDTPTPPAGGLAVLLHLLLTNKKSISFSGR